MHDLQHNTNPATIKADLNQSRARSDRNQKRFAMAFVIVCSLLIHHLFRPFGIYFAWILLTLTVGFFATDENGLRKGFGCMFVFGGVMLLFIPLFALDGHRASPVGLSLIDTDMNQTTVRLLLGGLPTSYIDDNGRTVLDYYKSNCWCELRIEFDADGTVRDIYHNH